MSTCKHVTGLTALGEILTARRISVFGHIARLVESDVHVHMALRRHIDLSVGRPSGPNWKRCPDRPRAWWIDQIQRDANSSLVELWKRAIRCGHAVGATHPPLPATRHWWWFEWFDASYITRGQRHSFLMNQRFYHNIEKYLLIPRIINMLFGIVCLILSYKNGFY